MTHRSRLTPALLVVAACDCSGGALDQLEAVITLAPDPLVFDTVPRGTSASRVLIVGNPSALPLHVSGAVIESGAGFTLPGETSFVVAPGGTHALEVRFTAGATASVEGALAVDSDARETPRARAGLRASRRSGPVLVACVESADVPLPLACDMPPAITFGAVPIGQARDAILSLRSEGSDPVTISAAAFAGHPSFAVEDTALPVVLAPGERLELGVRFTAAVTDAAGGSITVASNDAELVVALSGSGTELGLCVEPAVVDFGEVLSGETADRVVVVTACGSAPIEVTGAEVYAGSGEHTLLTAIAQPITLAPVAGLGLDLELRYAPVDEGEDRARLRIHTPAGAAIVQLAGRSAACRVAALPNALAFRWEDATRGDSQQVLLENTGAQACTVERVEIVEGGELGFTFGSRSFVPRLADLPRVLAPGESLAAAVRFDPARITAPAAMGRIEVEVLERPELVGVDLAATIESPPGRCELTASPASLGFGVLAAGETRLRGLRLLNGTIDTLPCRLSSFTLTGAAFRLVSNAPQLVWGEVFVFVELAPPGPGVYTGAISIVTDDAQVVTIPLSGASGTPGVCVSPRELPFGEVTGTSTRTFEISACAGDPVTIDALEWTAPDPELALRSPPALPFTLAGGERREVIVEYRPQDQDGDTAVVTVRSSDPIAPAIDVRATGGRELAPVEAGRYLFFWQIDEMARSDIIRAPLQGALTPVPFFGGRAGQRCGGCHQLSPDGRYVAVTSLDPLGFASLSILDVESGAIAGAPGTLLDGLNNELFASWNPDVNTVPPYQYTYSINGDVYLASLHSGYAGPLMGASDPAVHETMPSWGPDGEIAFVRWDVSPAGFGLPGATSVLLVGETGGTPAPLAGASGDGAGYYYPRHSPNGRWIAVTVSASAHGAIAAPDAQLRLVRADGSGGVAPLSQLNAGSSSFPMWSADGAHLSFSSNRPGGLGSWDVYIAPVDQETGADGPAINVGDANTPGFEHAAQWSP